MARAWAAFALVSGLVLLEVGLCLKAHQACQHSCGCLHSEFELYGILNIG